MSAITEKKPKADTLVRSIRIPRKTHEYIVRKARENCRTFRQQVEYLIRLGAKAAK